MNKHARATLPMLITLIAFTLILQTVAIAQKKTILLVRHAEKMPATEGDKTGDVDLSEDGRERAIRFMKAAKKYRPGEIYSTAYTRTRKTAEPIANLRGKEIQTYDASKHSDLIDKILKSKTKRFVVVGHSNTVPFLANLFAKKEIFRQLLDSEYGVYYVIRISNGVFRKIEVYTY